MCYVCDDFCETDLYRCFACNFNIHKACASLPLDIANYDQHVQPFTLMVYTSWTEDIHGKYFCDVCEERRKPNHGVYSCAECPSFVAHFECLLPEYSAACQGCGGDILSRELLCKCLGSFECHDHTLSWAYKDDDGRPVDIKCHGCGRYMPDDNYFCYCRKMIVSIT
ncbi:hypothetical protein FEM48_ZijujUnG0075000 [Ziziphus jujuba var. spinosa]|uniref:DC1 domain-containing protein n=1 Tax=Ziziphus jujuba var. spinosa TaxID=714518 RepID=A0A978U8T4_ZIZJJ|nr:hypothetical protein FEM48_ZijujUnG0075000 [Ziziphus jujuba var. spinosa]